MDTHCFKGLNQHEKQTFQEMFQLMLLLSYKSHLKYIKKTPIYNTWHYVTYLQYALITYYDLHITLLKELQYNVIT